MITMRRGIFETNSSSTDAIVIQIRGYSIPKYVNIDTEYYDDEYDGRPIDGCSSLYIRATYDNQEMDLLSYMKSLGVEYFRVDGRQIENIPKLSKDNPYLSYDQEILKGKLFGYYGRFSWDNEDEEPCEINTYRHNDNYYIQYG